VCLICVNARMCAMTTQASKWWITVVESCCNDVYELFGV
jgi:hypothetical protein